jgi:hypothetical protein
MNEDTMRTLARTPRALVVASAVAVTLGLTLATASAAHAGRRGGGMDECAQSPDGNSCSGGPFDGGGATGGTTGQPDGNTGWQQDGPGGVGSSGSGSSGGTSGGSGSSGTPVAVNNVNTVVADPAFGAAGTLYATYANGKKDWFMRLVGEDPSTGQLTYDVNVGSGPTQIQTIGEALTVISHSPAVKVKCTNSGPTKVFCY